MTRTELIIQLLKVAIGLAFGAYFVWWSLEVLDRLASEEEPTPAVRAALMGAVRAVGQRWHHETTH
jgi:TRAP-type C4-dicarboxylate transport system permease small subunit